MDSIRVGIRVRPLLSREKSGVKWVLQGENAIVPTLPGSAGFEFDHVFGESCTTDHIYNTITRPIVYSVMEGFNGTVFAYGQTSSGKTFTMMGTECQPGVIPLAVQEIFDYMEEHEESEFIVRVSYLEIYKEGIVDLLDPLCADLKIREDRENHVRVHGLKEYVVTNIEEVTRVIYVGNINRTTGETNMNDRSSRSHAVLSIAVESRIKGGDGTVKVASLNLVDLAGSERLNATGAAGKRAQEGIAINKSLFTLKQVISKLSEGNSSIHIPYRDSKLTHILKPSLGGNAKTAIICAVTPAEFYETELTLNFAICAKKVKNRPTVNEVLGGEEALKKKLKQLEKENGQLRCKLSSSEVSLPEERKALMEQIEEKECRQSELEARIRSLEQIIIKSKSQPDGTGAGKTGVKASRRKTICPATLAREMGSPLILSREAPRPRHSFSPVVTPEVVHRSIARIQKEVHFSTPHTAENFQSYFNSSGFERELITEQTVRETEPTDDMETAPPTVNVRDLERRRTMFRCPTFVVDTPASNTSAEDQSVWQEVDSEPQLVLPSSVADAQVQTDAGVVCVVSTQTMDPSSYRDVALQISPDDKTDSHTQTEAQEEDKMCVDCPQEAGVTDTHTQTEEEGEECPQEAGVTEETVLDSSVCLCSHHHRNCNVKLEIEETHQFIYDELVTAHEEELSENRAELKALEAKLKEMEMASIAQEEYLCEQSKKSARRQAQLEEKCFRLEEDLRSHRCTPLYEVVRQRQGAEAWEDEKKEMVAEASVLREQLQSLQSELQKLPNTKRHCSEPPVTSEERQQLTLLMEKLQESKVTRERESEQFQQSYQQKVRELQKAQATVCYLQEQLEEAEHPSTSVEDLQEELRTREKDVQEKEAVINSLQNKLSNLQHQLSTTSEVKSSTLEAELELARERLRETQTALQVQLAEKTSMEAELESAGTRLRETQTTLQVQLAEKDKWQRMVVDLQEKAQSDSEAAKAQFETQLQQLQEVVEVKSRATECAERKVSDMQTQLEEMRGLFHKAQDQLQEKEAKIGALEGEVEELKKKEDTLYDQIAECAEDYIKQIRDKELAWQDEREDLHKKFKAQQQDFNSQLHKLKYQIQTEVTEAAERKVSELQAELEMVNGQLHEAQGQFQEKEAKIGALEGEVEELKKKEDTLYDQIAECAEDYIKQIGDKELAWQDEREDLRRKFEAQQQDFNSQLHKLKYQIQEAAEGKVSELQAELEMVNGQLHEAQGQFQEKEAKIGALEGEVEELKKKEDTLYDQIAECAEDYIKQIGDKELAWQDEREDLHKKSQAQAEIITKLQVQVTYLRRQAAQVQQEPQACPVAMAEAEGKIKDLLEQNSRLKSQLQAQMTFQPVSTSAGAICCDSSGTITSAAYYHLRGEMKRVKEERDKFEGRVGKLKSELQKKHELYTTEQGECNRYRTERNVFRAKYLDLKERHAALQSQTAASGTATMDSSAPTTREAPSQPPPTSHPSGPSTSHPSQLPTSHPSGPSTSIPSQPPALSKPPVVSLPTPKNNPRRSIFSYHPPPPQPVPLPLQSGQKPLVPSQRTFTSDESSVKHRLPHGGSNSGLRENIPSGILSAPQGVDVTGGISSAPHRTSVLPSSDVGEQLWNMSMIQTAPLAPGGKFKGDQNKCNQQ